MNKNVLRLITVVSALVINTLCCIYAYMSGIEDNALRFAGSYAAFAIVSVLTWRFPLKLSLLSLIFVFLASSLGSVLNLYATVGIYDRVVHYLSGVILAFAGYYVCELLFKAKEIKDNGDFAKDLFALLFSCACAGFWEIYEFTVDMLLDMGSQGDNFNTMGDIVAGVLGAFTYLLIRFISVKLQKRFRKN